MAQKEQRTKSEHFIPQVYYRGFSDNGRFVMAYNITEDKQYSSPFSISDLSQKDYLYEYRDAENQIFAMNEIENALSVIEKLFSEHREELKKKAYHKENLHTNCFFELDEKAFWKGFLTIQVLRHPEVIRKAQIHITNQISEKMSDNSLRNITLYNMLSFDKILSTKENTFFSNIMGVFEQMTIHLFVDKAKSLFTSDRALTLIFQKDTMQIDYVLFPLTSDLALVLADKDKSQSIGRNCLHYFTDDFLAEFKKNIAAPAKEWIYSRKALSSDDIVLIKEGKKNGIF